MNANDDPSLDAPQTPVAPPAVLSREKVQSIMATVTRMARMPGAEFMQAAVEQLKLAIAEIDAAQRKIDTAQSGEIRAQREADTAIAECRRLREDLLNMRAMAQPVAVTEVKKRGPKAKVVALPDQKKAQ